MSLLNKISKMFGSPAAKAAADTAVKSRSVAKDRLSVILASQRGTELLAGVDMEALQRDVMLVVQKHVNVAKNKPAQFQVNAEGDVSLFEMSLELATSRKAGENATKTRR